MAEAIRITAWTSVSACGAGIAALTRALREERSGLRPAHVAGLDTYIGAVSGLDAVQLPRHLARFDCRNNRLAQVGLMADGFADAVEKVRDRVGAHRVAVILGTTTSGVAAAEAAFRARDAQGSLPASFAFDYTHDYHALTRFVAATLGVTGPQLTASAACASSTKVFADAWQWLRAGLCDAAVVGGVDSLCDMTIRGFHSLELLSREACTPFDAARRGLSIGEAAGFMLLERGRAEAGDVVVEGYGESSDAHHVSAPHPEGRGAAQAMRAALARAGLQPSSIDYVNLHGTGTPANDASENAAVTAVFGDRVPASSTKGWTGHTLGAAGITEAVIAAVALREGLAPRNLGMTARDPAFSLNVLEQHEQRPLRHVLSNSFGFGGANACVVLGLAQ